MGALVTRISASFEVAASEQIPVRIALRETGLPAAAGRTGALRLWQLPEATIAADLREQMTEISRFFKPSVRAKFKSIDMTKPMDNMKAIAKDIDQEKSTLGAMMKSADRAKKELWSDIRKQNVLRIFEEDAAEWEPNTVRKNWGFEDYINWKARSINDMMEAVKVRTRFMDDIAVKRKTAQWRYIKSQFLGTGLERTDAEAATQRQWEEYSLNAWYRRIVRGFGRKAKPEPYPVVEGPLNLLEPRPIEEPVVAGHPEQAGKQPRAKLKKAKGKGPMNPATQLEGQPTLFDKEHAETMKELDQLAKQQAFKQKMNAKNNAKVARKKVGPQYMPDDTRPGKVRRPDDPKNPEHLEPKQDGEVAEEEPRKVDESKFKGTGRKLKDPRPKPVEDPGAPSNQEKLEPKQDEKVADEEPRKMDESKFEGPGRRLQDPRPNELKNLAKNANANPDADADPAAKMKRVELEGTNKGMDQSRPKPKTMEELDAILEKAHARYNADEYAKVQKANAKAEADSAAKARKNSKRIKKDDKKERIAKGKLLQKYQDEQAAYLKKYVEAPLREAERRAQMDGRPKPNWGLEARDVDAVNALDTEDAGIDTDVDDHDLDMENVDIDADVDDYDIDMEDVDMDADADDYDLDMDDVTIDLGHGPTGDDLDDGPLPVTLHLDVGSEDFLHNMTLEFTNLFDNGTAIWGWVGNEHGGWVSGLDNHTEDALAHGNFWGQDPYGNPMSGNWFYNATVATLGI